MKTGEDIWNNWSYLCKIIEKYRRRVSWDEKIWRRIEASSGVSKDTGGIWERHILSMRDHWTILDMQWKVLADFMKHQNILKNSWTLFKLAFSESSSLKSVRRILKVWEFRFEGSKSGFTFERETTEMIDQFIQ